ncbi:aminotransferase class V-fold PLP-dependent enzyme [Mesorhizobium sp. KR9-304]|uniref:pyridoxal-phosphate-dependent aminotransferase family protein n=1 Tax=Mesorhizobium sp. KR9-304 TaxID=3156614 RepID=UPI0032B5188C
MSQPSPLLDLPPYPADGYKRLADRIGALLRTKNDVLLVQAEAIVALEAVATSIASPAISALNIVTSPYGALFGDWLRRGDARVADVTARPAKPIGVDQFAAALDAAPDVNLVSLVHAESASGILNPLPEIARLAKARGAVLVVDAVASFGGHQLDVDRLGVDIAVIGPQKALSGSSGLSAVAVGAKAWQLIEQTRAPVQSTLSLVDLKRNWLDAGLGMLPGMPSALEFFALEAALDRVEAEGLDAIVRRHRLAGAATRDAMRALGLSTWVADASASDLVTALTLPEGVETAELLRRANLADADLTAGVGPGAESLLRLNHTGRRAQRQPVLANVAALAEALRAIGIDTDLDAATTAIAAHYDAT